MIRLAALLLLVLGACQKRAPEVSATSDAGGRDAGAALSDARENEAAIRDPDAGAKDAAADRESGAATEDAAPNRGGADAGAVASETGSAALPRWIVKDNKIRCIKAPCMSLDAMPVGSSDPTEKISDVDLSALALSNTEEQAVMAEVYGRRGLEVEGEIVEARAKTGRGTARVLKVMRVLP